MQHTFVHLLHVTERMSHRLSRLVVVIVLQSKLFGCVSQAEVSIMVLNLTEQDIGRYAPYHSYPEFKEGYEAYLSSDWHCPYDLKSVSAQAWDRGLECALRHNAS
jgi:hypothetical protein